MGRKRKKPKFKFLDDIRSHHSCSCYCLTHPSSISALIEFPSFTCTCIIYKLYLIVVRCYSRCLLCKFQSVSTRHPCDVRSPSVVTRPIFLVFSHWHVVSTRQPLMIHGRQSFCAYNVCDISANHTWKSHGYRSCEQVASRKK